MSEAQARQPEQAIPVSAAAKAALLPLALAQFLCSYAGSSLAVAIDPISQDLNTTVTGVQTAITVFTLTMAALMIPGSKLTDIWGRKRTFLIGMVVYAAGALVAGLAPSMGFLYLGYSIGQGVGTALLIPPVYILVTVLFTDFRSRAAAFGTVMAAAGLGSASGPLIGGIITTVASWRVTFFTQVLLAVVIIYMSRRIQDVPVVGTKPVLDVGGAFISGAGLVLVVVGLLLASTYGWVTSRQDFVIGNTVVIPEGGISPVLIFVAAGLVVLWLFLRYISAREASGKEPLVKPHVLANPVANIALATQICQWFIILGGNFVFATYLQVALGMSPIETGLRLTPATIGILLTSRMAGRLTARRSQRTLILAGFAFAAVGIVLMLLLSPGDTTGWALAPGLFVLGMGAGIMLTPSVNVVQSSMPEEDQADISGVSRALSNLGSSLGTAVAGAVLVGSIIAGVTVGMAEANPPLPPTVQTQINTWLDEGSVSAVSDAQVEAALQGQPQAVIDQVVQLNAEARNQALARAMVVVGLVALLGLVLVLVAPGRHRALTATEESPAAPAS